MNNKELTKGKEENDCDRLVEMFANEGADMLGVCRCDEDGMVTLEPVNSKTGVSWSMSLITSAEEASKSKYAKTFHSDEDFQNFVKFAPTQSEETR